MLTLKKKKKREKDSLHTFSVIAQNNYVNLKVVYFNAAACFVLNQKSYADLRGVVQLR